MQSMTGRLVAVSLLLPNLLLATPEVRTIVGWGRNDSGQATFTGNASNVVALAAGTQHSIALLSTGKVVAWGINNSNQCNVPAGLSNVVAITAGEHHNLAIKSDGTVTAWGYNSDGQINVPAGLSNVVAVAGGGWHSLALKADGRIVGWGGDNFGQLSQPAGLTNVIAISAGYQYSLALQSNGRVVAWGSNEFGQTAVPAGATNIVAISAGAFHAAALRADGTAIGWGYNDFGSVDGANALTNTAALSAAALALKRDGTVTQWGWNAYNQLNVPAGLTNVVAIAAASSHSLALRVVPVTYTLTVQSANPASGVAIASSSGHGGTTAYTNTVTTGTSVTLQAPQYVGVGAARKRFSAWTGDVPSASATITFAMSADRTVCATYVNDPVAVQIVGWGLNDYGQINIPAGLTNVIAIAAGWQHSVALRDNGTVMAWGLNNSTQCNVPAGLSNVVTIAAGGGGHHTLAIKSSGTVVAWGLNGNGQCNVPGTLSNVVAVAGGAAHSLAVKSDGTVVCWGSNSRGQLTMPVGLSNVTAVAAGVNFSLALKRDGTVVGWGGNDYGEITIPAGATNVVALSTGGYQTAAIRADGTVVAWGQNVNNCVTVGNTQSNVTAYAYAGWALRRNGTVVRSFDDSTGLVNVPAGLTNVIAIAGAAHTLALKITPDVRTLVVQSSNPASGVAIASSSGHGGNTAYSNTLTTGTSVTLAAPQYVGVGSARKRFSAWTGDVPSASATITFAMSADRTVRADYVDDPVTHEIAVAADPVAGGTVGGAGQFVEGSLRSVTASALGSYVFVEWTEGGTRVSTAATYTFTLSADRSLVAHFVLQPRALTVQSANPASGVVIASSTGHGGTTAYANTLSDGTSVTLAAPQYLGAGATRKRFSAWTGDVPCAGATNTFAMSADRTVCAVYVDDAVTHAITVAADPVAGGTVGGAGQVIVDSLQTVTAIAAADYNFVEWTEGGSRVSTATNYAFTVTADRDLVAHFALKPYTLAVQSANPASGVRIASGTGHAGVTPYAPTVARGGNIDLEAPPYVGIGATRKRFTGWTGDVASSATAITVPMDGDKTVCAQYVDDPVALTIVAWGRNDYGQTTVPAGLTNAIAIAAGWLHSVALRSDGTVVAWGVNNSGQTNVPPSLANVTAISAGTGGHHTLALRSDGTVAAWGSNTDGQCNVPGTLSNVVAVAAGGWHSLALKADGTITGWGGNNRGQLSQPVGLSNVTAIAAGYYFSLALKADGTVVGWGGNDYGQIAIPAGATNIVSLSTGGHQTAAIRGDGTVIAWGHNDGGCIEGAMAQTDVTAFSYASWALKRNGTVVRCYADASGLTDVPAGLTNVVAVAATAHTLALVVAPTTYPLIVESANPASGVAIASGTGHGGKTVYTNTVVSGTSVSLEAPQYFGAGGARKRFSAWTGDVPCASATNAFTVSTNRTVCAEYVDDPVTYAIAVAADPIAGGVVGGAGQFAEGSLRTVTAAALDGYAFVEWTEAEARVSTDTNYTFTVSADRSLVAHFALNRYTLTVQSENPAAGVAIASTTGHGGTTAYDATVEHGSTVGLEAPQYVGAGGTRTRFVEWTGSVTGAVRAIRFAMQGGNTVTARYVADPTLSPGQGEAVEQRRATFSWPETPGATWYYLWINRGEQTLMKLWVPSVASWTPPTDLPAGSYQWWVQPWGPVLGLGPWSQAGHFVIPLRLPGTLVQIAPQGPQDATTLSYRWTKDANATYYRLWIGRDGAGAWHDRWYNQTGSGEGGVPVAGHAAGGYSWWIQGWGPDGYGPWSGPVAFSLATADAAKPDSLTPLGSIGVPRPTFQWNPAPRAQWYRLYVNRGATTVIDLWMTTTQYTPSADLATGAHSWWVGAWNDVTGRTVWSDRVDFTAP